MFVEATINVFFRYSLKTIRVYSRYSRAHKILFDRVFEGRFQIRKLKFVTGIEQSLGYDTG